MLTYVPVLTCTQHDQRRQRHQPEPPAPHQQDREGDGKIEMQFNADRPEVGGSPEEDGIVIVYVAKEDSRRCIPAIHGNPGNKNGINNQKRVYPCKPADQECPDIEVFKQHSGDEKAGQAEEQAHPHQSGHEVDLELGRPKRQKVGGKNQQDAYCPYAIQFGNTRFIHNSLAICLV